MASPRLRRVQSQRELESVIDDFQTQGYALIDRGESTALLKLNTWGTGSGHVLCALLTFWWTAGLGNLVYAVCAHVGAPQVYVKLDTSA